MLFKFQFQSVAYVERSYLFSRNKKPFLPTNILVIVLVGRVGLPLEMIWLVCFTYSNVGIIVRVLFFCVRTDCRKCSDYGSHVWGIWNCAHRNPCDWILTMRAYNPTRKVFMPRSRIPSSKYVIWPIFEFGWPGDDTDVRFLPATQQRKNSHLKTNWFFVRCIQRANFSEHKTTHQSWTLADWRKKTVRYTTLP